MTTGKTHSRQFVVCLKNEGDEASLERTKIYVRVPDRVAEPDGLARIIDESGESYLYPLAWFGAVTLETRVGRVVARAS